MVRLDLRGDAVLCASRLDHVRVERPLDEKTNVTELRRLLLEDADELLADDRPLLLGIADASEAREEPLLRLHVHEGHAKVAGERLDDLLGLVLPQQAVIDEDAGELVADRLVDEQRRNRRVDPAREGAKDSFVPDSCANETDLLLDDRCGRPGRRNGRHVVEEVLQDLLPVRRVHDLGVELDAVQPLRAMLERGDRRRRRRGRDGRPFRRSRDRVPVAHPDRLLGRQIVEELGVRRLEARLPELGDPGPLDGAPEVPRHQLHPVTDPECGHAELEDPGIEIGRVVAVHRGRPAGEDESRGVAPRDLVSRQPVAHELRVHARLAHAPRDQLAVLPPEIDDEHWTFLRCRIRSGERDDLGHQCFPPSIRS